ncbi:MAG: hypothetical protein AAFY48_10650 [Bacteroidota bacterium]
MYAYDLYFSDGDGVIARFRVNPLGTFIVCHIFLLLLLGISSSKSWLSNAALSLFSILVTLFLIEKLLPSIATHQAGIRESIQPIEGVFPYTSYDTAYFKNYVPNCEFHTQLIPEDGSRKILHRVNSDAMRGPEVPEKAKDERRILLVGDSYIQALQVAYEESIGPQLESLLPDSFSVLQHGFPSWSPLLEWNWILRKGLQFDPDLVVLFLYPNDFYSGDAVGDSGYLPYARFNEEGEPIAFDFSNVEAAHLPVNRNPWTLLKADWQRLRLIRMTSFMWRKAKARRMLEESELPRYLEMSTAEFRAAYVANNQTKDLFTIALWDYLELMRASSIWSEEIKARVEQSLQHISGLQRSLQARNIPMGLCLIPYPWQFSGENLVRKSEIGSWNEFVFPAGGLRDVIKEFSQESGIALLDLYSATSQHKEEFPDELLYCPSDPHWTVEGHQMAAKALLQFLPQIDLLEAN